MLAQKKLTDLSLPAGRTTPPPATDRVVAQRCSSRSRNGLDEDRVASAHLKKLSREAQIEQRQLWDEKTAKATEELKGEGRPVRPADKEAFFKRHPASARQYAPRQRACSSASWHEITAVKGKGAG